MILNDWFSQFLQNSSSLLDSIKNFFEPPQSKKDYYTVGKIMISKKLVVAVFVIVSVLSAVYLLMVVPEKIMGYYSNQDDNKIYTKYYNSRSLKKYSGEARVVSKKSKAKYVGEISEGVANGKGYLYSKLGNVLYNGDFENNQYSGDGTLYYEDGGIKYIGSFRDNNFNGLGALYDEKGRLFYQGEFVDGQKNGKGALFNNFGTQIFDGTFLNDKPSLEQYLDKGVNSLSGVFLEDGVLYNLNQKMCIIYKDLGVMVVVEGDRESLSNSQVVDKIYILDNKYFLNEPKLKRVELDKKFAQLHGVKQYAGYTRVLFYEMSLIDYLRKIDVNLFSDLSRYNFDSQYTDVLQSQKFKSDDKIYVQSYEIDDLAYSYYFNDKDSEYVFYSVERVS